MSGPELDDLSWLDDAPANGEPVQPDPYADEERAGMQGENQQSPLATSRLGLITAEDFLDATYKLEYLIGGIRVKDQPGVTAGPEKSLKTTTSLDEAASYASGAPYLGRFPVPTPRRVIFISAESGRMILQRNLRLICQTRGIARKDLGGRLALGFKLPHLTDQEHLDNLAWDIELHRAEVCFLDPLYLAMVAGPGGDRIDMRNMFQTGPLLLRLFELCLGLGCTPIVVHHFKDSRPPFEPGTLADLAYSGLSQLVAQWIFLTPSEPYDEENHIHRLTFVYGGRALNYSGQLHLEIKTGRADEEDLALGGAWDVSWAKPSEKRASDREQRQRDKEEADAEKRRDREARDLKRICDDAQKALSRLRGLPAVHRTKSAWKSALGWNGNRFGFAFARLELEGRLRNVEVSVRSGNGWRQEPGFAPADEPESPPPDPEAHTRTLPDVPGQPPERPGSGCTQTVPGRGRGSLSVGESPIRPGTGQPLQKTKNPAHKPKSRGKRKPSSSAQANGKAQRTGAD